MIIAASAELLCLKSAFAAFCAESADADLGVSSPRRGLRPRKGRIPVGDCH
jgi:hypothetical protein